MNNVYPFSGWELHLDLGPGFQLVNIQGPTTDAPRYIKVVSTFMHNLPK